MNLMVKDFPDDLRWELRAMAYSRGITLRELVIGALRDWVERVGPTVMNAGRLIVVPMTLAEANAFVEKWHRHHGPVQGCKFCIGVAVDHSDSGIVGVAIVGRPVARLYDDGWTLEVTRSCTDGTKNANSCLYGACRRTAWALGYKRLITYTLPEESGISLTAAGWKCIGAAGGGTWDRALRPRVDKHPLQGKICWEAVDNGKG